MNLEPERSPALEWVAANGHSDRLCEELSVRRARRRRVRRAQIIGCGTFLLAGLGAFYTYFQRPVIVASPAPPALLAKSTPQAAADSRGATPVTQSLPSTVEVATPTQRVLPDGTVVELNKGASIDVRFAGGESGVRQVDLKKGEAEFRVIHNAERPFVVNVSGVEVQDVGTKFAVQLDPIRVVVIVSEGEVRIRLPAGAPGREDPWSPGYTFVEAGQCLVVPLRWGPGESAPRPTSMASAGMDRNLSWLVPRLRFSGTPLGEAVPLFTRYAGTRIRIDDPALNGLELSGVIRADNTDALLKLLKDQFGVSAEKTSGEIRLHR